MKVPAVKPYFWALKLLTTAMGEAMSDFVVLDVNKYLGVVLGFLVFVVAIVWQFRTPQYRTWPYWTAVSMVAVFGTMAADVMHVALGVPYMVSAAFYAICLIVTFVVWYRVEGTLNIHSIVTRRREVFYWLAVIFTFAMGTALGDLFATTFNLGYLTSAFVFIGLILLPLIAWRLGANPVLTFWVAYIITRPIGASFADFFGQPKDLSGMGYGHAIVAIVMLVVVVAFIIYLSRSGIDQPEAAPSASLAAPVGYGQLQYGQPQATQQPQYGNPQYGDPTRGYPQAVPPPQYGQPQYGQAQATQQPQYGQPQYGDPTQGYPQAAPPPQYGQPQYGQPQYGQSQFGQPQATPQPQYGDPTRGYPQAAPQPQYGQPQNGQPQATPQPQYGQPQYGDPTQGYPQAAPQPQYGQPQNGQPQATQQPQYGQPQYGQSQFGQPQATPQPQYGQPQYGDPTRGYPQAAPPPQYGQPQNGQPQATPQPQDGQPQYGAPTQGYPQGAPQPQFGRPQQQYGGPGYADPGPGDPRYVAEQGDGNTQDGDQRER